MNIILIGMPGCGKSTVGVVLAKETGYAFLDTDLLIQKREGLLLQEIIDYKGLPSFLRIEEEVLLSVDCENTVIATGGSAVYSEAAMAHLKSLGIVVYLNVPEKEIERRLRNLNSRGVAGAKDKTLSQLYAERIPLYEQYADFIIDCSEDDVSRTVDRIAQRLQLAML